MSRSETIFIIDDDAELTDCLEVILQSAGFTNLAVFSNVVDAINTTAEVVPDLILLDILLTGPNGFALLNELASYADTAEVPVILLSSLALPEQDLSHYNIKAIFDKAKLEPRILLETAQTVLEQTAHA